MPASHDESHRRLLESIPHAVEECDAAGLITYTNRACRTMMRLGDDDRLGSAIWDQLTDESDKAKLRAYLETLVREQPEPTPYVGRIRARDGHVIDVQVDWTYVRDGGTVCGFAAIISDVTDRVQAEEALRASEEKWRTMTENAPDYVMMLDPDAVIRFINRTVSNLRRTDVIGRPIYDFLEPAQQDKARTCFERVLASGEPGTYEVQYAIGDAIHTFESRVRPIRHGARVTGFAVSASDVTDRLRAEEERRLLEAQVQHAQKLESLGLLAGGVAHDFNNLLQGVLGNADLALDELPEDSPARAHLAAAIRSTQRATELCGQMLAYAGRGQFARVAVDLSAAVVEMASLLRASISKKARLVTKLADEVPAIQADVTQIRQVILNLIINASEALGDEPGSIVVTTGVRRCTSADLKETYLHDELPGGDYACLEVTDSGCGIDPATLKKIFDPFFSTKFTGRGLGLASVLGIVRRHGGALDVQSEPGGGSTFRVLLPTGADAAGDTLNHEGLMTGSWRGRGTVLVVEDEPQVREVVEAILRTAGFEVMTAEDGQVGVDLFRAHAPSIAAVLLDMTMPRLGGLEALAEMLVIDPGAKVLLTSGYTEENVGERATGAAGFLHKPYRAADLVSAMHRLLEPPAEPIETAP